MRLRKTFRADAVSGLDVATKVLEEDRMILAFVSLTSKDVVRHPLVQKIVQAYEDYEKKTETVQKYRWYKDSPEEKE